MTELSNVFQAGRGVMRGVKGDENLRTPNHCGGHRKVPTMSQVISSMQYICFRKTSGANMGGAKLASCPRAPSNLVTPLQTGCFNFAQMKASVELCINRLSDATAKSELKATCQKFDRELEHLRTPDGLAYLCVSSGMAFCKGHRKIGKLIIPTHKMGNRSV